MGLWREEWEISQSIVSNHYSPFHKLPMYSYLSKKFNLSRKAKVKSTWVSVNLSVYVLFFHDEYLVLVTVADFVVNDVINIGTAAHVEAAEGVSRTVTSIEPALRHLPLVGRGWRVPQDLKKTSNFTFQKINYRWFSKFDGFS